jgi:hypothetical protein
MTATTGSARDDRVLPATRLLSAVIVPFLLAGFVLLYLFPGSTDRLFAWTIAPTMTSMVLASAYLGGAYFFVRALREPRWHVLRTGFLAVTLFAGLLGVATLLHWDRFHHANPAFWIWSALYFSTPFLVSGCWLLNQRVAAPAVAAVAGERLLGSTTRAIVAAVGLLALVQGVVMFLAPGAMIPLWPWSLTPLTCRVLGAVFCLGCAGVSALRDPRWTSVRLMVQVEVVMVALIALAAVRGRGQFATDRPLTWVLAAGFGAVLAGSGLLWYRNEVRPAGKGVPAGPGVPAQ